MKNKLTIKSSYLFGCILIIAGIVFFVSLKRLFFFDEDIFVADDSSGFFNQIWQRVPICKFIYVLENIFFGKNPAGYHITNLLFHLANAVLGLLVLQQLLKLCDAFFTPFQLTAIPFIFFIIFLCAPMHSESLCYILARDGSIVAFFCLLSILFFLKSGLNNRSFLLLSLISFLVALFTYEISWLLPVIILGITIFWCYSKRLSIKKHLHFVLPFFILFAVWFLVKIVFVDKMEISDYKNESLLKINFLTLLKNNTVLFLRNFIPPMRDTRFFLSASTLFGGALATAFFKIYKKNKPVFFFCLLLLLLIFSGFFATVLIGIDSHDSESERYIYFSSCFAMMLLATLLVSIINNKWVLLTVVFMICGTYFFILSKTINYYKEAGLFSQYYMSIIKSNTADKKTVILIDMPSQHHGALMFRAKSRIDNNVKNSVTTLNEFMTYLYPQAKDATLYIALSSTAINTIPSIAAVCNKPLDSINYYYPASKINLNDGTVITDKEESYSFLKSQTAIIVLKDSCLFVFK